MRNDTGTAWSPRREVGEAMVTLNVNETQVTVPEGTTIMEAAEAAGVHVPHLCYLKGLNEVGACRVCVVEVEGCDQLVAACNNPVSEGMTVRTNSPRARKARKTNLGLLLSQHNTECTTCVRSGNCVLQSLSSSLGLTALPFEPDPYEGTWNQDFPLIRDNGKCVKCLRCIQVCDQVQASKVWCIETHADHTTVGVTGGVPIEESCCTLCGQCITHCPTGALRARDDTDRVFEALADPSKIVIAQMAPAVRTSWGEPFGLDAGQATAQRLVAALRAMGFDYVFDTNFSADVTIMEEGSELLERLGEGAPGPLFTSCCPGWVRFAKAHYPHLVDRISTSKSPQGMFGALVKTYYAELLGVDPRNIFHVSIMPCVAKKHECAIPVLKDACGEPDVDVVLTIREVDRMIASEFLDVAALEESDFDTPLGTSTGAAVIFGATGGVMEAALRTASYLVTGEPPAEDAFQDVRGLDGWKEATFDLNGTPLRVAVASGLANTSRLINALDAGEVAYDFVEIMACPGGCAGGGGHPIHEGEERAGVRGDVLWGLDKLSNLRNSYENPAVQACYENFLGSPLSERAEHLLHTDQTAWKMPGEN